MQSRHISDYFLNGFRTTTYKWLISFDPLNLLVGSSNFCKQYLSQSYVVKSDKIQIHPKILQIMLITAHHKQTKIMTVIIKINMIKIWPTCYTNSLKGKPIRIHNYLPRKKQKERTLSAGYHISQRPHRCLHNIPGDVCWRKNGLKIIIHLKSI